MNVHDVSLLRCPDSSSALSYQGSNLEMDMMDGVLVCPLTGESWAVDQGVARLYRDLWRTGSDAAVADQLDAIPAWIEPIQALTTRAAGGGRIADLREAVVQALQLEDLPPNSRARVLEVGVHTAANFAPIQVNAPQGSVVELWGTDLSIGALRRARQRLDDSPEWYGRLSLFMADPHRLPFVDGAFERVFVCGGFDCFADGGTVMSELCRVVCDDGLVVIVDKQPAESGGPGMLGRWVLSRVGKHAVREPRAPMELVPDGARDVRVEQMTPAHYCLSFRPPPRAS
jgi:ubiquinone/menaquinone biosynthesis C-methylase UbiE/uncharacterized protein YbaR (Trm112 family)